MCEGRGLDFFNFCPSYKLSLNAIRKTLPARLQKPDNQIGKAVINGKSVEKATTGHNNVPLHDNLVQYYNFECSNIQLIS